MEKELERLADEILAEELARRGWCGTIRNNDGKTLDLCGIVSKQAVEGAL